MQRNVIGNIVAGFVLALISTGSPTTGGVYADDGTASLSCSALKAPLADDFDLTFNSLAKFVSCNHFTRIEQVLKGLPARLRSRYLLVYKSNSRHKGATFDEPRIILEDDEAKIIIAAAGNPAQINGDDLEVIENPGGGSDSIFHFMTFPEEKPGSVIYSGANPTLCSACHRQHLSPNWESYPEWPGVYGSGSGAGFDEETHFNTFVSKLKKQQATDPNNATLDRYEALTDLSNGKTDVYELESRNHTFSQDIGMMNEERIEKVVTENPLYPKLEPAFQAASQGCANLEEFFPPRIQANFKESLATYAEHVRMDTLNHFKSELKTIANLTGGTYEDPGDWLFFFEAKPFIPVGYIMKYVMNIDPDAYAVTFQASVYNSHHTLGGLNLSFEYLVPDTSCAALKAQSLNGLR